MSKKRHCLISCCIVLLTLALAMGIQALAVVYFETNHISILSGNPFHITMGRLQQVQHLKGDVVIIGSSVTERMRSSEHIAVIGVPGAPFTDGLSLIQEGQFPKGTCFVLEGFNIASKSVWMRKELASWNFRATGGSRHFSYAAKPASLLLTGLGCFLREVPVNSEDCDESLPRMEPVDVSSAEPCEERGQREFERSVQAIKKLMHNGYRVCIAYYPEHSGDYERRIRVARDVAHLTGAPLLDYSQAYDPYVVLSDKAHFQAHHPSTIRFRNILARDARLWARSAPKADKEGAPET